MNRPGKCIVRHPGWLTGLILILLLVGCSATPRQPPPLLQAAEAAGRMGIKAEAAGQPRAALAAFNRALTNYAAIEDNTGVALSLVNLARIERRLGEFESAAAHLDRARGLVDAAPALGAEIAFEQGLLLLARRQPVAALGWAQRALNSAAPEQRGRAHNLVGRILLRLGESGRAREEARQALAQLPEGELVERANAHRLLGEIGLAAGEAAIAEGELNQALALDKSAGLPPRIAGDLRGLSRAATLRQAPGEARERLQRAFTVTGADGDYRLALELLTELIDLYRSGGDIATAQRLEEERQLLVKLVGGGAEAAKLKP